MQLNISNELMVEKHLNGIRLVKPEKAALRNQCKADIGTEMKLPFEVFLMNPDATIATANDRVAETCGTLSPYSLIGTRADKYFEKYSADFIISCDAEVMSGKKVLINEYDLIRRDALIKHIIAIRMPVYGKVDSIVGVFGYSAIMGKHSLVDFFHLLSSHDLLKKSSPNYIQNTYISTREYQCLKHLVRGKTMRQIGQILNLSTRTIESYIENVKLKLNVSSKSQLIDVVFEHLKNETN